MPDWQELMSRYGGAVWHLAYRILGNRADADECFQEAFLAALEYSRRKDVQHWRALLLRMATARAVDRLRRRRRQVAYQQVQVNDWESIADLSSAPAQSVEEHELSEHLRTALGRLPAKQAEAFCLHCLEEWSYQEVAQQMAVSTDSVGVLLHRARKRLRDLLGESLKDSRSASHHRPSSNAGPLSAPKEPS